MSTHMLGFQSFFSFLHHFVLAKLAASSTRVEMFCGTRQVPQGLRGKTLLRKTIEMVSVAKFH